MSEVVILVPRRADDGPRDELWDFVRRWWEREQSPWPIVEGHHNDGLFSRSAALNTAARLAGDWRVAVIIDADVVCDPDRVRDAVGLASETRSMILPHDARYDLSPRATRGIISGRDVGDWERHVRRRYAASNGHPSVSSVVVVSREQWDLVGGFDESFRGWGYEDTAFAAACETFGGIVRMPGVVWHLWHPTAREGKRGTVSWSRNSAKGQRYRAAIGDANAIRALQAEGRVVLSESVGIPRIIHRVVPETTTAEVESFWARTEELHPDWTLMTHRDPLVPEQWPLTSSYWHRAANGAQLADMVRLEALIRFGGIYVDSDVEVLRSLEPLTRLSAFAAWEDERCVPNAVLGATRDHPAIRACLDEMLSRIPGDTWRAGPGVTTDVLVGRDDVLLLPPGSFYPYHYRDKHRRSEDFRTTQPWAFAVHHWAGSWL